MKTNGFVLGIDPDVDKSGFALLDCARREFIYIGALSFPDAARYLDLMAALYGADCLVVIEDSDRATNYHYSRQDRQPIVFAKGRSVGMCHATLRHLHELADFHGLNVLMQPPLRKCWAGQDRKISHREITQFATGFPAVRSNQEERDAALLAWVVAGYPIRLTKPILKI